MSWTHVHNKDELEAFYRSILANIKTEAEYHGYAIAVHGSLRRDLDLIAVPWRVDHADKDDLARAIQEAACGFPQESYQWERKPCGRLAVSFPVCWTERNEGFPNETNLGHIDLSLMPSSTRPEALPNDVREKVSAALEYAADMISTAKVEPYPFHHNLSMKAWLLLYGEAAHALRSPLRLKEE